MRCGLRQRAFGVLIPNRGKTTYSSIASMAWGESPYCTPR